MLILTSQHACQCLYLGKNNVYNNIFFQIVIPWLSSSLLATAGISLDFSAVS